MRHRCKHDTILNTTSRGCLIKDFSIAPLFLHFQIVQAKAAKLGSYVEIFFNHLLLEFLHLFRQPKLHHLKISKYNQQPTPITSVLHNIFVLIKDAYLSRPQGTISIYYMTPHFLQFFRKIKKTLIQYDLNPSKCLIVSFFKEKGSENVFTITEIIKMFGDL